MEIILTSLDRCFADGKLKTVEPSKQKAEKSLELAQAYLEEARLSLGIGNNLAQDILALTGITIRETGVPGEGGRFEMTVPPDQYRIVT